MPTFDFGMGPVTVGDDYQDMYTKDMMTVDDIQENDVFVFGSNKQGEHFGGAARFAYDELGAEWGVGEGRTGMTYAFPTLNFANTRKKEGKVPAGLPHMVSMDEFAGSFELLKAAILAEPEKRFLITKLGLGIAGWQLEDVHKMFWDSGIPFECKNIKYPIELELPDACTDEMFGGNMSQKD